MYKILRPETCRPIGLRLEMNIEEDQIFDVEFGGVLVSSSGLSLCSKILSGALDGGSCLVDGLNSAFASYCCIHIIFN